MFRLLFTLLASLLVSHAFAAPPELGTVKWLRNHDDALAQAKKSGKPVFLLFQEVPG